MKSVITSQVISHHLEKQIDVAFRQSMSITDGDVTDSSSDFVESYKVELNRIKNKLTATGQEIEENTRELLLRASEIQNDDISCTSVTISILKTQAHAMSNQSINLYKQTHADAAELLRISEKADEKLHTKLNAFSKRKFQHYPWKIVDECGQGTIVILLSDIHTVIRNLEIKSLNKNSEKDFKEWVGPTSFERVTTKYWIHEKDLYQVLLKNVSELPLLVYGQKGDRILSQKEIKCHNTARSSTNDTKNRSNNNLWTSSITTTITSVYFDSAIMSMYSNRIKRIEGAQLFRIRWYGKLSENEKVFLEIKTHHEQWINNSSIKERVSIHKDDVVKLLDLKNDWDEDVAMKIVQKANPHEEMKNVNELTKLVLKIKKLILKHKLTPCVRTKYTRAAFQSSQNNKFRFTIDKDVTVVNERASSSSWCLDDITPTQKSHVVKLPYCVYEVKVSVEDNDNMKPIFVTDLENDKVITEAKKFSKFLSGASIFNADTVGPLPWWALDTAFLPIYNDKCSKDIKNPTDHTFIQDEASMESILNRQRRKSSKVDNESILQSSFTAESAPGIKIRNRTKRKKRRSSIEILRLHKLFGSSSEQRTNSNKKNRIAPKTNLRVEPKSHFANERTFIQWISAALLFVTLSQLLFILASQIGSNVTEATLAGTWMLSMSLFISIYALFVYYRRVYLMLNGKPYGYADFIGPAILAFSIISGIILLIVYTHRSIDDLNAASKIMIHMPGICVKRTLESNHSGQSRIGLNLELQPSGVIVDESKGLILVPTNNRIIALRDGLPSEDMNRDPVNVVASLKGTDIEALQYVGDYIFALSEAGKGAEIIALQWVYDSDEGGQLKEIHRWMVSEAAPEGIAMVPGEEGASYSGDVLIAQTSIKVFDLDSFQFDVDTVDETSTISNKLIARGLKDPKVGSMQYFEGLLWVLFDNSHVMRAFDLKTGSILHEIQLPVAEVGSESQWEGMYLQRIANNDRIGGLRGNSETTTNTTLILHLALDTPAQIWTLRLNEIGENGQWSLPSCAGV